MCYRVVNKDEYTFGRDGISLVCVSDVDLRDTEANMLLDKLQVLNSIVDDHEVPLINTGTCNYRHFLYEYINIQQ